MTLTHWISLALVCALGALSPGPSLAMVVRHSVHGGRRAGISASLSHALGVGIYALLTVWGLGAIIQHQPLLYRGITLLGALYLAWLGYQALRTKGEVIDDEPTSGDVGRAVRNGLLVALGNPKLILFFVALLSQFVETDMTWLGKALIVSTAMIIDGAWYMLVVILLSQTRVLDLLRTQAVWLDRIMGILLLALAFSVFIEALA
ncbi:LysE family translocator [Phytohalomonas tamaricis]|uniref:LysE family translocator n=1 Tax=Phytohalomonas tamaricis TaxID=2081032 RepID=UPI000D0B3D4F|nr:LysE family translocator [Phytohalomonas tamaricis]